MSKFSRSLWSQNDPTWWNVAQWADVVVIFGGIAVFFISGTQTTWVLFVGIASSLALSVNRVVRSRRKRRREEQLGK